MLADLLDIIKVFLRNLPGVLVDLVQEGEVFPGLLLRGQGALQLLDLVLDGVGIFLLLGIFGIAHRLDPVHLRGKLVDLLRGQDLLHGLSQLQDAFLVEGLLHEPVALGAGIRRLQLEVLQAQLGHGLIVNNVQIDPVQLVRGHPAELTLEPLPRLLQAELRVAPRVVVLAWRSTAEGVVRHGGVAKLRCQVVSVFHSPQQFVLRLRFDLPGLGLFIQDADVGLGVDDGLLLRFRLRLPVLLGSALGFPLSFLFGVVHPQVHAHALAHQGHGLVQLRLGEGPILFARLHKLLVAGLFVAALAGGLQVVGQVHGHVGDGSTQRIRRNHGGIVQLEVHQIPGVFADLLPQRRFIGVPQRVLEVQELLSKAVDGLILVGTVPKEADAPCVFSELLCISDGRHICYLLNRILFSLFSQSTGCGWGCSACAWGSGGSRSRLARWGSFSNW